MSDYIIIRSDIAKRYHLRYHKLSYQRNLLQKFLMDDIIVYKPVILHTHLLSTRQLLDLRCPWDWMGDWWRKFIPRQISLSKEKRKSQSRKEQSPERISSKLPWDKNTISLDIYIPHVNHSVMPSLWHIDRTVTSIGHFIEVTTNEKGTIQTLKEKACFYRY